MNKLTTLLCFLVFALTSCFSDVETDYPDTKLIKGQWQLVENEDNDSSFIYRFTTDSENTWSWGGLITYRLAADGTASVDKRYTWHVSNPANEQDHKPRLEMTWFDAPDSDDIWDATEYYVVVKLTPSEMWLKREQKGLPNDIKKFIRRNDLSKPSFQFED